MILEVSINHSFQFLNLILSQCLCLFVVFVALTEAQPTPEVYQGDVIELLKEFTKNRDHEQRLDAPNLEYLDKESQ